MGSTSQSQSQSQSKKHLSSLLVTNLTIPSSSSSSNNNNNNDNNNLDFEFSHFFGPHPPPSPSSSIAPPHVIHNRSHSFVGPSPRLPPNSLYPLPEEPPSDSDEDDDDDDDDESERQLPANEKEKEKAEVKVKVDPIPKGGGGGGGGEKIGPGDFEIVRMIGQGSFGKVFLVKKRKGRDIDIDIDVDDDSNSDSDDGVFAMKVMKKDTIIKKNHVDYMRAERDILTKILHPFIVQLRYSFQTKTKLYLILDFINGGHLFFHLYRQGIFSEDQARIYTAEIVSAVSHLHKNGIVHRDLKPENILMDAEGHVMLTDFGLSKEIDEMGRSNSMCGTTEYMAPEILMAKGHNKDADWWSVGILLYEMLTGKPPYTHNNRKKLQEKIIKEKFKLPPFLTGEAHSLLKGLLVKDPSTRLGSGPNGDEQIKSHKWFRSINWKKLEARELQPKFKPDVLGKECTANFDQCWTAMPPNDSPASTPTAGDHFQGYTYVAPNPWLSSG